MLDRRIIIDSGNDPQLVHATVPGTVGFVFETYFTDGFILLLERRDDVLLSEAERHQSKQRVFGRRCCPLPGIGYQEATRTTERGLRMASEALVGIVAGSQSIGIGVELREHRVEF